MGVLVSVTNYHKLCGSYYLFSKLTFASLGTSTLKKRCNLISCSKDGVWSKSQTWPRCSHPVLQCIHLYVGMVMMEPTSQGCYV